ncbi:helix-turn-helix domain-containing protein [Hymenobacter negativus]|uniref:AraC family transcriptional regulator n=1 Tax=Hymenobacter negativus TaxID=2795026 RepID=A0ABS3QJ55_9BACT|nr:helix-turn-helix domain-containing protein [Hymenobacter negativus]MBO2011058.1 AraC family transcriptional regulator [Hymenobacter negativus]
MQLHSYLPTAALRPFVKTFLIVESGAAVENRLLPDASIVLALRFKGYVGHAAGGAEHQLPAAVITGLRKSSRRVQYAPASAVLLVVFHADGAAAFFREPLHELFGTSEPLEALVRWETLSELTEKLAAADSHLQRIALVEHFLWARLRAAAVPPLVRGALQHLRHCHGNIRIKALAEALNSSQDPLEKQFRRVVGASPKQFATILRFRQLLARHAVGQELTGLAYEAGYFDQSHFIHDFRAFTGQAPHEFFQSGAYW